MQYSRYKIIFSLCAILICITSFEPAFAGTILVTNTTSSKVTLLDEDTFRPIKKLRVGYMPHEVAVSPNGKIALVSNWGDLIKLIVGRTLSVIDIANAQVVKTIELPRRSRPHGLYFLSDSKVLVTAEGIQSLLLVDIDYPVNPIKQLPLPGVGAHMIAVDNAQKYAYVSNTETGSVCKVDLRNWSVVGHVKIGKQAEGITLTPDENLLLTTNAKDHFVAVIRTKDLFFIKKIPTHKIPIRVVLANNGKSAAVTNSFSGTVQMIDLASLTITKSSRSTISRALIFAPSNIVVTKDETIAYIANFLANNVAMVDLKQGKVLKTVRVPYQPNGIALSPVAVKAKAISKIS